MRRHIKPIVTFFAMTCAAMIYTNLDHAMLGFMASDTDVGYYGVAVTIRNVLISFVTSLGAVLLPRASYYVERGDIREFQKITRKALNFVFLIATPLTIYFIIYAGEGISFLSGKAFSDSIIPMQMIMPTVLLVGITNILGIQILVPTGREKLVLYSEMAGAAVDLILNALLIPRMKSTGAALGTLVAEVTVLCVQYYVLRNEVGNTLREIHYKNIIAGILLGLLSSVWVKALSMHSFFSLVVSAVMFFGIYGVFLIHKREDMVVEIIRWINARKLRN